VTRDPVVVVVDVCVLDIVAMPSAINVPPIPAFSFTPRPPNVRIAPVKLVVEAVVASQTRSPPV